jgi:hypothetical protein
MSNDNNPLKAYFRRPAIYFKLPSGSKYYADGVVDTPPNGELPVYPMTSIDELTIRTPDALFNGAAVVDVIKSCIPAIKDPWKLNDIDLEAIIIAIRAASVDGKIEIASTCPSCKEDATYDIDLMRLLVTKRDVDYTTPLNLDELVFQFRPLTFAQSNANAMKQFEVQRMLAQVDGAPEGDDKQQLMKECVSQLNSMLLDVIAETIESIATPETVVTDPVFIREFLAECDTKTNTKIKEFSAKLKTANDTPPIKIECIHCHHEYEQQLILNFTSFFA